MRAMMNNLKVKDHSHYFYDPECAVCVRRDTFYRQSTIRATEEGDTTECPQCGSYVWNGCFAHCPTRQVPKTTWTTEYPTKPGYYWIRNHGEDRPEIAEVFLRHDGEIRVYLKYDYDSRGPEDKDILSAEWFGPIEPPEGAEG